VNQTLPIVAYQYKYILHTSCLEVIEDIYLKTSTFLFCKPKAEYFLVAICAYSSYYIQGFISGVRGMGAFVFFVADLLTSFLHDG